MIIIGLTGSIATGKSTVSSLLRSPPHSLPIIDADILAREVVSPGTYGYNRILSHFGPTTPDLLLPPSEDSKHNDSSSRQARPLNRAVLGRRVFGSSPSRQRDRKVLNSIIHPLVRLAMLRSILYYHLRGYRACVLDIPLLYESALDIFCSVVVMVAVASPELQMKRLRARDTALSPQEASDRVGSQIAVGEKVERTRARGGRRGKVVWNDAGLEELDLEVRRVMGEVEQEGGGLVWGWWLWGSPVGAVGVGAWEVWRAWAARRKWEEERGRERARL